MNKKEQIIRRYFDSWITGEVSVLSETFSENAVYIESYGPLYRGLDNIIKWFENWNEHGSVLEWKIFQFIHNDKTVICEWFFKCVYDNKEEEFNGISVISFDSENKITLFSKTTNKSHTSFPDLFLESPSSLYTLGYDHKPINALLASSINLFSV